MMHKLIVTCLLALLFHPGFSDPSTDGCEKGETCITIDACREKLPGSKKWVFRCGGNLENVCCPMTAAPVTPPTQSLIPEECGRVVPLSRVLGGGEDTDLGEFPWIALLQYRNKSNNSHTEFLCGGALISKRYVLSAAHCMRQRGFGKPFSVRLGEYDLASDNDCIDNDCTDAPLNIGVESVFSHERYNNPYLKNDIALIRLKLEVTFTNFVAPICLPFGMSGNEIKKYDIAGWIAERRNTVPRDVMQKLKVSSVPTATCDSSQTDGKVKPITDLQLCSGGYGNYDVCRGDSGSPLMAVLPWRGSQRMFQMGVASFGSLPCGSSVPSVYTNVVKYTGWIETNLRP